MNLNEMIDNGWLELGGDDFIPATNIEIFIGGKQLGSGVKHRFEDSFVMIDLYCKLIIKLESLTTEIPLPVKVVEIKKTVIYEQP